MCVRVALLLVTFIVNVQLLPTSTQRTPDLTTSNFHPDCADPHNTEVACTVHKVDCKMELFPLIEDGQQPPDPHDLRIDAFAKAVGKEKGGKHELHVDLSWQMPPKNESTSLKAFKLEIKQKTGPTNCFAFNVTQFELNEDSASPRFHFTSDSLFDFEKEYIVTLYSLPFSKSFKPKIIRKQTMPADPGTSPSNQDDIEEYCKTHSHPEAFAWTAGFRKIFLQSIARTIQIEFVGAPPQYCFEEYELRLLDETGIDLLHNTIIRASDMKKEEIDGKIVSFGEFNFTDLDLDTNYIPSVLPVETASDGRCLCPTSEQHGACSCTAADWKKVRLHRIEKPAAINVTIPPVDKRVQPVDSELYRIAYVAMIIISAVLIIALTIVLLWCCCKRYKQNSKPLRIRYFANNQNAVSSQEPRVPLITQSKTSVLVVYAQDCPLHEAAVMAFAELLKEVFGFVVHIDAWDTDEIESNLAEYVNSSIVRADKVIVINSVGAYHRARARHMREDPIARISASPTDGLFCMQIDLALQHARVISMRFSYTPSTYTIFSLSPLLQYTVPDNLGLLIASLNDNTSKSDPRLNGFSPELSKLNAAVSRMTHFTQSEPKWFENFHHRLIPVKPLKIKEDAATTTPARPIAQSASSASPIVEAVVANSPIGDDSQPLVIKESDVAEVVARLQLETIPDEPVDSGIFSTMSADLTDKDRTESDMRPRKTSGPEPKDPRPLDGSDSGVISDYIAVSS